MKTFINFVTSVLGLKAKTSSVRSIAEGESSDEDIVRSALLAWHQDNVKPKVEELSHTDSLWHAIESEIVEKSRANESTPSFLESLRGLFEFPQLAPASVGLVCGIALGVVLAPGLTSSGEQASSATQLALQETLGSQESSGPVTRVSSSRSEPTRKYFPFSLPNGFVEDRGIGMTSLVRPDRDSLALATARSGKRLRRDVAHQDVEWVRSARNYEIRPARHADTPPVIFVAQR